MSNFHFAVPGPLYWDFKCLVCDDDVNGHFTRNLIALIKGSENVDTEIGNRSEGEKK